MTVGAEFDGVFYKMFVSMFQVAATTIVAALMRFTTATYAGGHSAGTGISSFPVSRHGPVGYHGPLAKPVVQKDGHLADTLEVAAARGEHLIALSKAHSTAGSGYGSGDDYGSGSSDHGSIADPGYEGALHGIYSYGPATGDIYKGEYGYAGLQSFSTDHSDGHGNAGAGYGAQSAGAGYGGQAASYDSGHDSGIAYHGQLAAPVVLKSGYLADTHDVAAAKGSHYVALSLASQHGGHH